MINELSWDWSSVARTWHFLVQDQRTATHGIIAVWMRAENIHVYTWLRPFNRSSITQQELITRSFYCDIVCVVCQVWLELVVYTMSFDHLAALIVVQCAMLPWPEINKTWSHVKKTSKTKKQKLYTSINFLNSKRTETLYFHKLLNSKKTKTLYKYKLLGCFQCFWKKTLWKYKLLNVPKLKSL